MTVQIHHGDCLDVLRAMPDNSVDAVICDPPYGLSNTSPDKVADTIVAWASGDREHVPTGKGFMGASWDAFVPPPAVWDECYRVLKPGGHLAVFAGARTQDLMGLSTRLAGFDLRDSLAWLYGSGFPKSLDVGKAIDKLNGRKFEDRYALGRHIKERRTANGHTQGDVNAWFGYKDGCQHWERQDPSGARVPTQADYDVLKARLGLSDEHDALVARVEAEREVIGIRRRAATGRMNQGEGGYAFGEDFNITAAATPEAEKYQGVGTALKPAHEPIILARKPFQGTVAQNTLTWGTGGLNIDATRIGATGGTTKKDQREGTTASVSAYGHGLNGGGPTPIDAGRWPANVVLDPDTAKALDQQSGPVGSNSGTPTKSDGTRNSGGMYSPGAAGTSQSWEKRGGGASRFFKVVEPDPPFMYAAKAPKRERPSYVNDEGKTIQHSTVKPLSICRWLAKLTCPPGGTILDPFAGSGTTIEAAMLEGFNVIGIEREAEYLPLIQQRIDRATPPEPVPTETDLLDLITGDAA